ncbi:MAG: DUF1684 domain-containing protein [Trueperaceae bacterium]|nr:DUF1684 domain-containing protein [Trueperaceae bacterium]
MNAPVDRAELADYRRRVSELYAEVRRAATRAAEAASPFRRGRDQLFADHPQSPLRGEAKAAFDGITYYPYDPSLRLSLPLDPDLETTSVEIELGADGVVRLERVARVRFTLAGEPLELTVFWIGGYGGGLFLPFGDATNGDETYGGGRYLLDTIKGADLGGDGSYLNVDFNYAYNPSCAYDARWTCPLAPPENRLHVAVRAGERHVDSP